MKINQKIPLLALFLAMMTTSSIHSQVRPDIYSFNAAQRDTLVNLMMEFITPIMIEYHCDYVALSGNPDIHSDFDFLPFHRTYIERMEDSLIRWGYPQYVPLPKWNPSDSTPLEFRVVDGHCAVASLNCNNGVTNDTTIDCNPVINWTPNISVPYYISLPTVPGNYNDLCDWPFSPTAPGGTNGNGLSRVIEGDGSPALSFNDVFWHNSVHGTMGGAMGFFSSPAAPIFWLWHAYVDDVWKTWEENCPQSTTRPVDLYMKDNAYIMESIRDRGEEPDIDTGAMWISRDIWCRNQNDGFTHNEHQNPISDGVTPVHVYVKVRNRGYQSSTGSGTEVLKLYWAKAATALTWPDYWNGSITTPALMGDIIDSADIPSIAPGSQDIMHFTWLPPDPSNYDTINSEPWHFCLLARIVASNDSMYNEQWTGTWNLYPNVQNNNNIVWKNLTVVDQQNIIGGGGGITGGHVAVGNAAKKPGIFRLEFANPINGTAITEDAEVNVILDDLVWQKWLEGGRQATNMMIVRDDLRTLRITGNPATLGNLSFKPHERGLVYVGFNFLTDKMPYAELYNYHLVQKLENTGRPVGGEMFEVIPPVRNGFIADAGPDNTISQGETTKLNASDIGEPAIYNWYSPEGRLIFTGKNLEVSPEITSKYRLEVIAGKDGLKDYDEARVKVKIHEILTMTPNPATLNVNVEYKTPGATSAYLVITMPYGNVYNQYILNVQNNHTTIDLSDYQTGAYSVILVVDGVSRDAKSLVVQ